MMLVVLLLGGCGTEPVRRPSILLVVLDTVRADAVSAHGVVEGTTPTFDTLARDGVRYARAYSNASWTLPSHASLFTGMLPSAHGVGWRRTSASPELLTLAEVLSAHGYDTVGVSENPWVTPTFNMSQGFARFELTGLGTTVRRALREWLAERDASRPFFAFVNVVDAHAPYTVRDRNPHTPGPLSKEEAQAIPQEKRHYLCRASEHERAVAGLHGLYLRDVTAADEKLAVILELVRTTIGDRDLVTVVTSDHGEHFGEHELVDHVGGLRNELLHVPLVVHGLPQVAPAVVHEPVQLTAVAPTVLALAGIEPGPWMTTPALPYADVNEEPGALVAEFYDPTGPHEPDAAHALLRFSTAVSRSRCDRARDRLFGRMQSLIDFPYKLVWYEEYPVELFDLGTDPHERRNLAPQRPELTGRLLAMLREQTDDTGVRTRGAEAAIPPPSIDDEVRQRLRTLGYLPDDEPAGTGP